MLMLHPRSVDVIVKRLLTETQLFQNKREIQLKLSCRINWRFQLLESCFPCELTRKNQVRKVCFSLVHPKLFRKDVALIKSRKNGLIVLAPIISPIQFILDFAFRLFLYVINRLEKWNALKALRLFPSVFELLWLPHWQSRTVVVSKFRAGEC